MGPGDNLPRRLRSRRAELELSLRQVADAAGLSKAYVHKLERGDVARPTPSALHCVGVALDVPYLELMRLAGYL